MAKFFGIRNILTVFIVVMLHYKACSVLHFGDVQKKQGRKRMHSETILPLSPEFYL
jgi:hypothetical protein